jgi:hypothetical protein
MNKPLWRVLTPAEWDQIWHHVTTCDFALFLPVMRQVFAQSQQPGRRQRVGLTAHEERANEQQRIQRSRQGYPLPLFNEPGSRAWGPIYLGRQAGWPRWLHPDHF